MELGSYFLFLQEQIKDIIISATKDVRRCSEFAMCPTVHFHVSGRTVDSRRVRVHESSDDLRYGVRALTATREYCGLDAQRCWGMGLLLGVDCEDVDKEKSDKCVVDDLVLPLVHIVYRRNELQQLAKLQELRQHCPRAFTLAFKGKKDLELFADAEYHLTRPYAWEDEALRWRVLQYANSLPWLVFGMTEEQESLQQGDGRGFTGVLAYAEHSQCAVFVAQQLLLNQQRFNTESFYSRSTAQVLEGDEVQPTPVVPGASLYVFVESVPVTISFRWFITRRDTTASRTGTHQKKSLLAGAHKRRACGPTTACLALGIRRGTARMRRA